jgi:D-tyrosyl-tRNA(Tyr) deacylase
VRVDTETVGAIGPGLLILVGIGEGDNEADAVRLAEKTAELRIFADDAGRFNRSLIEVAGEALVVSQFTLYADTRRGRRPGFSDAAAPEIAEPLVETYAAHLEALGIKTARGRFGAHMHIALENDGPVTIIMDSR